MLGLNALSEFAALAYSDSPTNLQVMVGATGKSNFQKAFTITDSNSLELQRHPFHMSGDGTTLQVSATGTGCALAQVRKSWRVKCSKV